MKDLNESIKKAMESAKKRREKYKEQVKKQNKKNNTEEYLEEMKKEYQDQIDSLSGMEKGIWDRLSCEKKAKVLNILHKTNTYDFFKDSTPEIGLPYLIVTLKNHGFQKVRHCLNKAYEWLLANPNKRKKNYRRFLTNWLKSENSNVQFVIKKNSDDDY